MNRTEMIEELTRIYAERGDDAPDEGYMTSRELRDSLGLASKRKVHEMLHAVMDAGRLKHKKVARPGLNGRKMVDAYRIEPEGKKK